MTDKPNCACTSQSAAPSVPDLEARIEELRGQVGSLATQMATAMLSRTNDEASRRQTREAGQLLVRIIGGVPADPGTYSECCLIGNSSGGGFLNEWFCTGTLIHPRVVVTALHCIAPGQGAPNPNSIAIGVEDQRKVRTEHIHRVLRIERSATSDIALLILQKPSTVAPVALATSEQVANAGTIHLVGFGNTDKKGLIGFGIKREVEVPMNVVRSTPDQDLTEAEGVLGFNSRTEFVAGRKGSGQDSCNGDSGGPAYIGSGGNRVLAGATSRATDEADDNCGDGGIYVRLDAHADWIGQVIAELG